MRIDDLIIHNFEGSRLRKIHFAPGFTLLAGDNGAGKSTVLRALAVAVGSWFLGLRGYEQSPGIEADDVRAVARVHPDGYSFEKEYPSRVECTGVVRGRAISWVRELPRGGGRTSTAKAKAMIEVAAEAERRVRAGDVITLPLICSYGAARLPLKGQHTRKAEASSAKRARSRFDGYRDCLHSTNQETSLIDWIAQERTLTGPDGRGSIAVSAVIAAMARCVEGARGMTRYDERYQDLVLFDEENGPRLFKSLGGGPRTLLTLVGDLAKRAVTLNPHLKDTALRDTPGVVMIEELELHLHPRWQRQVIHDLKATFPSLQFIVTTHSPQLLGEARHDEIRLLSEKTVWPRRSFGMDSNRVLEEIMRAPSRNPSVEDLLKRVFESIDRDDFGSARGLLTELEAKLGSDDPEVTRARALMTFLESEL